MIKPLKGQPKWIKFVSWAGDAEDPGPVRRFYGAGSLKTTYQDANAHYIEGSNYASLNGHFTPAELDELANMVDYNRKPEQGV